MNIIFAILLLAAVLPLLSAILSKKDNNVVVAALIMIAIVVFIGTHLPVIVRFMEKTANNGIGIDSTYSLPLDSLTFERNKELQ